VESKSSFKAFGDGEQETPFYLIREKECPRGLLGHWYMETNGLQGHMYLFRSRDEAQKYMEGFCKNQIRQDPKKWEVVSSDVYGGIFQLLQKAAEGSTPYTHVWFLSEEEDYCVHKEWGPFYLGESTSIKSFADQLSGDDTFVDWDRRSESLEKFTEPLPEGEE
jgi:hypothetical protein